MSEDPRSEQEILDGMLEFLTAQHRDTIAKAFVMGQQLRVFVDGDEIRMEAVDVFQT